MKQLETLKLYSHTQDDILKASNLLKNGEVVAIPTETVYGLGANALDENAVLKIFQAKGRPQDNPLIIHISSIDWLYKLCDFVPEIALKLADNFWPGALTLVLKKSSLVPSSISRGLDTVAIRFPSHKVALQVISNAGVPIAAPSANTSGRPSTTTGDHVLEDLDTKISAILYDDICQIGLESTVVDLTQEIPILLRPGGVTKEQIEKVIGKIDVDKAVFEKIENDKKVNSPGMKYRHYAPKAELLVLTGDNQKTAQYIKDNAFENCGVLCFDEFSDFISHKNTLSFGSVSDANEQAKYLFSNLRKFDDMNVSKIFAQCPSDNGLGLAITNRLKKASGFNILNIR